jgi:NADP-dependent 3-hydroxy acid dehydrogenase YdfG
MSRSQSQLERARREVVVVTGASSGVGRAVAHRFAQDGAKLALLARSEQGLEAVAREVEALGGQALPLVADVADYDAVRAAAVLAEVELGPVDVWVNNAMTTVFAFFQDVEPAEFKRATEVTYLGAVWGLKAALELMQPRDRGVIVQVGSALAYRGIPLQAAYCGAKHGVQGVYESLRAELYAQGSNVQLRVVQLPGLNTPQFDHCRAKLPGQPQPVPPIFQPEVAARAIHWAAHHPRRELWVGWPTVKTIWGSRLAPGFVDRYLGRFGVSSQQTDEPLGEAVRAGNLDEPRGDYGAHGRFDARAKGRSIQLELALRKRTLYALGALAGGCAYGLRCGLGRARGRGLGHRLLRR